LERMPASDQAVISSTTLEGKLNDFPSSAIRTCENTVICRLSRNPEVPLTVKFRDKMHRRFLPSDLPSKRFAWGQ
jgi:hypothetical protein